MTTKKPTVTAKMLESYGIFFSNPDLAFLKAHLSDHDDPLETDTLMTKPEFISRRDTLQQRFQRIVGRCQDPVGAYNQPLGAPIELLKLPISIEDALINPRADVPAIQQVSDLFAEQLTHLGLRQRYPVINYRTSTLVDYCLDQVGLPGLAESIPDDPIYRFFHHDTDWLTDRQRFLLLDVQWGNMSINASARQQGITVAEARAELTAALNRLSDVS